MIIKGTEWTDSERTLLETCYLWIIITWQLGRKPPNLCVCVSVCLCVSHAVIWCVSGSVCHPPSAAGPAHSVPRVRRRSVWRAAELDSHPLLWKPQVQTCCSLSTAQTCFVFRGTGGLTVGSEPLRLKGSFTSNIQYVFLQSVQHSRH